MRRFFAQHLAALRDAWRRLVSTPLNSLLSLIVIGAALTLPSVGWVVLDNLRGVGDYSAGPRSPMYRSIPTGRAVSMPSCASANCR